MIAIGAPFLNLCRNIGLFMCFGINVGENIVCFVNKNVHINTGPIFNCSGFTIPWKLEKEARITKIPKKKKTQYLKPRESRFNFMGKKKLHLIYTDLYWKHVFGNVTFSRNAPRRSVANSALASATDEPEICLHTGIYCCKQDLSRSYSMTAQFTGVQLRELNHP